MQIQIGQQRADDGPLWGARRWCPTFHVLNDVLLQPARQQLQQATIADVLFDFLCKQVVRDAVKVAFEVSVHHVGVAFSQVSIDFPQRVLAAFARSESVTYVQKFFLKDRLYHPFDRRLHDSVFDGGDAQGSRFTACFGYINPPHRLGPVLALFEVSGQFAQIHQFVGRKSFYALPVYACSSLCLL